MSKLNRKETFDLANGMVPTMVHRGMEVDQVAKKLMANSWLNIPDPVDIEFNITKHGFNYEKKLSCYTKDDITSLRDFFEDIIKFVENNLDK